jgi:phenylpyruvate tautomerase PptA (4-oxalocrotonate tautomerase family)
MFEKNYRKVYIINEVTDNNYQLCKVLNEYSTDEAITEDLKKLLAKEITEEDLLKEYGKKGI